MSTRSPKSEPVILNKTTGQPAPQWMVEPYGDVDVREAVKWIKAIRFEDWPQQSKVDDQLRPAMVTNLDWHDFRNIAVAIVKQLGFELSQPGTGMGHDDTYQWMLSCVMPGHGIEAHKDAQADYWKFRVHVPLLTNPKAFTEMEDGKHHLEVGKAYKVNTAAMHAVENGGRTPRVHFMFDVR